MEANYLIVLNNGLASINTTLDDVMRTSNIKSGSTGQKSISLSKGTWKVANSISLSAGVYIIIFRGHSMNAPLRVGTGGNYGEWTQAAESTASAYYVFIEDLKSTTTIQLYALQMVAATDTAYTTIEYLKIQ